MSERGRGRGRGRGDERGVMGGILAALVIGVIVTVAAIGYHQVTSVPDLGGPPLGPADGPDEHAIAAALAPRLARGLVDSPHPVILISQQDLTVLARAHNPEAARLRNPVVRTGDGVVMLSGDSDLARTPVVTSARLNLTLGGVGTPAATVEATVERIDVGNLTIPGWMRSQLFSAVPNSLNLNSLFGDNPTLRSLTPFLECVAPAPAGVRLGFHRPGATPDPAACGPGAVVR